MVNLLYFDMIQTITFAIVLLMIGSFLCKRVPFLHRYNIPAPVVGGILFALLNWFLRSKTDFGFRFDTTLQSPFMIAFFTTIGLAASLRLLKEGGKAVFTFLLAASVLLVLQNLVSWGLSIATGLDPLLGLLAGSITMSGGHGTGATFADHFIKQYQLAGATEVAMAAATFGLVSGSLLGGPIARRLITKKNLKAKAESPAETTPTVSELLLEDAEPIGPGDVLRTIFQLTLAMSLGSIIYTQLVKLNLQFPTYLFSLFVGIFIRNFGDATKLYKVDTRLVDYIGSVSLSIFLAMALMNLQLWQLVDLAIPMLTILTGQVALMAAFAYFVTFNLNGRDYEAAVLCSGHCGFGLGATPNAIANMQAVVSKYGPAPRAFFLVSIVGAFFVDIVNAVVIQGFVSLIMR